MKRRAPWLVRALVLLPFAACGTTCRDPEQLAELAAFVGGEVERDEASTQGKWHAAKLGTRFRMGDGIRTGEHSAAELALLPSGSANVSPHSVLRFMATPPRETNRHVALEVGELEVLAEQIDLDVHTPRAVAIVSRGSKLKLSMRDGRERFDLVVGRVVLAYAGEKRELSSAQPLELTADNRLVPAMPVPPDTGNAPVPSPEVALQDADAATFGDAGSAVPSDGGAGASAQNESALRLRTLESATLHVASAQVVVALPTFACGTVAQLRIDGQALAARDASPGVPLTTGNHRVLLACSDGTTHEARLTVKRDPARLELPKHAQSVRVEADGRRYTVRYQNLLPDLTFRWPGADDDAAPYTLVLRSGSHELTRSLDRPEHALSGTLLGEGEHKFWFRDANGRSSKPTVLRLAFDNTARSAYLSRPLEDSAIAGQSVLVEGAALVSSRVSIEGTPAKLDEQGRFRQEITLDSGQKAVSVRVEHPGSGVHYYLRRLH